MNCEECQYRGTEVCRICAQEEENLERQAQERISQVKYPHVQHVTPPFDVK